MLSPISFLSILFDYILGPAGMWCGGLLAGFGWVGSNFNSIARELFIGAMMMIPICGGAYQMGCRGAYREGRKRYFYIVFVTPVIVGFTGLLIGLLQLFMI